MWLSDDIARILRQELGPRAAKVPTRRLPDFVLGLAGWFQADARFSAPMIGKRSAYSTDKAATLLDWKARPAAQAVIDCAQSLIQHNIV